VGRFSDSETMKGRIANDVMKQSPVDEEGIHNRILMND